ALRVRTRGEEQLWRARPNWRVRGIDWPLFSIVGGLGTGIAWLVVVVQDAPTRYAGLAWLAVGFVFYPLYRRPLGVGLRGIVRARNAGRAVVDEAVRRSSEIIVMGGPRRVRLAAGKRAIFGDTVDFVLRHAPVRVMVIAARAVG